MTWAFVVIAVLVVVGVTLAAIGRWDLGRVERGPEPDVRPQTPGDPNFDVVLRGYRMDEVDQQVAAMQAEIDRLSGTSSALVQPEAEPDSSMAFQDVDEAGSLSVQDVRPTKGPKGWNEHSELADRPLGSWREQ